MEASKTRIYMKLSRFEEEGAGSGVGWSGVEWRVVPSGMGS